MRRSLILRGFLVLGVLLFVAGPLTAATATAAKHHRHHVPPPPPPPPPPGPKVAALGDLTETSNDGGVGFAFEGTGWYASEPIQVASPGLLTTCVGAGLGNFFGFGATIGNPATITTDFGGVFNIAYDAINCAPGVYQVTAQEVNTPNRVATTTATITAPAVGVTGVTLSPASEIESGVGGSVAGTIVVSGLNPNEFLTVASPSLTIACTGGGFMRDLTTLNSTSNFTFGTVPANAAKNPGTDFAGNTIIAWDGSTCNAGSYPITTTETGAGRRSFNNNFTVVAP
jgi:hypothetical protein